MPDNTAKLLQLIKRGDMAVLLPAKIPKKTRASPSAVHLGICRVFAAPPYSYTDKDVGL